MNEFIARNGLIALNNSNIIGTLSATTITAATISATTYYGNGQFLTSVASANTFTTASTYNAATGVLTNIRSDGSSYTAGTWNYLSAATINGNTINLSSNGGILTANTINAVTGGTYNGVSGTITLLGSGTLSTITGLPTVVVGGGIYTTGFTYSSNTFTLTNNTGGTLSTTINVVTGLTINGVLSATTITAATITATTYYGNGQLLTGMANIFTSDGTLQTNRSVNLSSNTLTLSSSTNSFTNLYMSGTSMGIGINTFTAQAPETIAISASSTTSYNLITAKSNVNNYSQFNIFNLSNGTGASSDFIATNNIGSESNYYTDMGINSSGFSGSYIGYANDGYVYHQGNNFWVGNSSTASGTGNVYLFAGNSGITPNITISAGTGFMGINTTTPTNYLTVSAATNPVRFIGLTGSTGDTNYLTVDATGVIHQKLLTGQIILGAAGSWPSLTSGSSYPTIIQTTTNRINYYSVGFAPSAQTYSEWGLALPSDFATGGTITANFLWLSNSPSTGTSGTTVWGLQGIAYSNGIAIDTAYGAAAEVIQANQGSNVVNVTTASTAVTLAGNPSPTTHAQFRVYRKGSASDVLSATTQLLEVKLNYTRT